MGYVPGDCPGGEEDEENDENAVVSATAHPMEFVARKWLNAADYKTHGKNHHCPQAVAIAMAESSGDCKITSSAGDRGLWQINRAAHPDVSDTCAYDCICNAQAAFKISGGGQDWTPWVTWNNGAYKKYHDAATTACKSQEMALQAEVT